MHSVSIKVFIIIEYKVYFLKFSFSFQHKDYVDDVNGFMYYLNDGVFGSFVAAEQLHKITDVVIPLKNTVSIYYQFSILLSPFHTSANATTSCDCGK